MSSTKVSVSARICRTNLPNKSSLTAHHLAINIAVRNSFAALAGAGRNISIDRGDGCENVRVEFLAAVLAVIFFGSPPAAAKSLRDTLDDFGFFGRWAMDCAQPASPANNVRRARISPTGDPVFSESLGGDGEPNVYVVLRARRTADDTIVLRTKLNGEIVQELIMRREGNRLRTMSNRDVPGGDYVVRNGVVLSTRAPTPWLAHCTEQPEQS
jgi:hypothetical protein